VSAIVKSISSTWFNK